MIAVIFKTIAGTARLRRKHIALVACLLLLTASACRQTALPQEVKKGSRDAAKNARTKTNGASTSASPQSPDYGPPERLADIEEAAVTESSGLAASRRHPGLFWTHNDSGGGPFLYLFDRKGRKRGVWKVAGAQSRDWEDIAAGPGPTRGRTYIYIGDIGDNNARREEVVVYRVVEPSEMNGSDSSKKKNPLTTEAADAIRLRYPDGAHDAETLLVHPSTGDLYIVTKNAGTSAGVYKLKAPHDASATATLARVGEIEFPDLFGVLITGGDISPDGRAVALCNYFGGYELRIAGASSSDFDKIWAQPPVSIGLGARQQGEAVAYRLDGAALLATSEKRPTPLIEVKKRGR